MTKFLLKYSILASLIFGWVSLKAQDPMSLYFLENVPQSNFVNPAMAPRCNGFIGIPAVNSIYLNFQTNIPANTLLQATDSGTVTLLSQYYDYSDLYKSIGDGVTIRTYELISPLVFGFRLKKGYVTFAISEKIKMNAFLAKGIFEIPEKGFPEGTEIDLANTGIDAQLYQEYALGYSRNISKKFRVGGRLKLLQGMASIKSEVNKASLKTSKDVWNLDLQGTIYSSGPLEIVTDEAGLIDSVYIKDIFKDIDAAELFKEYGTSFQNMGFAVDLGATYDLNRNWSFSISVNDLGFISWKKDLNSIHFNGDYDFTGLNIDNSNVDSISQTVDALLDSIKTAVNYHAGKEKFTTTLGTMVHAGIEYNVNHVFSVGLLSRSTFDRNYFHQEFNLSANLNLYKFLTANLNYNIATNGENYLGLGIALRGGPLQFYMLLDHIPVVYTNYVLEDGTNIAGPYDLRAFNVMFGFNLIFGAHGYKDAPKIDAYSEF